MQRFRRDILFLLVVLLLTGCAIRKYVPEGKAILTKTKIEITGHTKGLSKSDISRQIPEQPVSSLFGWFPRVYIYYTTLNKTDKKFYKWVNESIGRAPTYYTAAVDKESKNEIITYLNNTGFFQSTVESSAKIKNARAKVTYKIHAAEPYVIRNIKYVINDTVLANHIRRMEHALPVKVGDNYNAYTMDDQRDVIVERLRNRGYFRFTKDMIFFEVDTNFNEKRADVTMHIIGDKHDKYVIDNIFIHPDYKRENTAPADTTPHVFKFEKGNDITFQFVCNGDPKMNFKTFNQVIQMHPGEYFNMRKVSNTYSSLGHLKIYARNNIRFDTVPSAKNDTVKHLNCDIALQKGKANSYNIQLEGTNSGGNFGALGSITYRNNNIFHGSEILTVKVKGGYQHIKTTIELDGQTHFHGREFGVEANLTFPRFLGPLNMRHFVQEHQPSTTVALGYNTKTRPLYRRQTMLASFGYNWMTNNKMQHILTPINLNTVKVDRNELFEYILSFEENQRVKDQYTSHLIFGLNYSFIFSNQNTLRARDIYFIKADIETSGNFLSLFNRTPLITTVNDYHEIFGIRYAQYVKLGIDLRYFHYFNKDDLAFRLMAGYGIPYGNSRDMPFEKNYYAGGANGMRGWPFRGLGPGGYQNPTGTKVEQIGNIQLEFNAEYRFPIYNFLHGAVFTDIGNIWNSKSIETFPNSEFRFDTFYKQLAMDMGLGIRLDFSFFLIRFDFAIPCRDPKYDENQRWRFSKWQWKDVVFNFGIGYPF